MSDSNDLVSLVDSLVGRAFPSVPLSTHRGTILDLASAVSQPAVIYLYPGSVSSPDGGDDSLKIDAAQHRAFCERHSDLRDYHLVPIGLSSEPQEAQFKSVVVNHVTHALVSDPHLQLARELDLPTFSSEGSERYRRITLIVSEGHIRKVFFPVANAERSAAQVLTWTKLHEL